MSAITLINVPKKVPEAAMRRAEAKLLTGPELHLDVDHLAGTWSAEEANAFDRALAEQREIDAEICE
ncbi:MAG TPA: hypothetical protein VN783_16120 [Thermoanaerobaculia bacterium]|nr:hypothetical protein [Thermoanaerobaculia bacterium]